jgi:hypothetical protein
MNALNAAVGQQFVGALDALAAEDDVRVVIVAGAGHQSKRRDAVRRGVTARNVAAQPGVRI